LANGGKQGKMGEANSKQIWENIFLEKNSMNFKLNINLPHSCNEE